MMHSHEAVEMRGVDFNHFVQLFDSEDSVADSVTAFFHEGFAGGETLVAVMDERRWYAVAMRLAAEQVPVDEALDSGQIVVRDAKETMNMFMRRGHPDRQLFAGSVGALMRELASRGTGLRVYGEMVDVLASEGDFDAAHELEELWNEEINRTEMTLFCGYTAAHFGDPRQGDSLRQICRSHCLVRSNPRDLLGSFLLRSYVTGR
jgi:hypothetical protein